VCRGILYSVLRQTVKKKSDVTQSISPKTPSQVLKISLAGNLVPSSFLCEEEKKIEVK
jgi:hypothetical protein